MSAEPFTNLMPDYRTDARLGKVAFMKMKKFLEEKGAPKSDLFVASTKFALVAVAEKHNIKLEPLLDELGPYQEIAAKKSSLISSHRAMASSTTTTALWSEGATHINLRHSSGLAGRPAR